MHIDPSSERMQAKLAHLEAATQERLDRKRRNALLASAVLERRQRMEAIYAHDVTRRVEQKDARVEAHRARTEAMSREALERSRLARMEKADAHARAADRQRQMSDYVMEQACGELRATDDQLTAASVRRVSALQERTERLRARENHRAASVATNRGRLAGFVAARERPHGTASNQPSNAIQRAAEQAHIRNRKHEERRERAQSARNRVEQLRAFQVSQELGRIEAAAERKAAVQLQRQLEREERRVLGAARSAQASARVAATDAYRDELRRVYLDHFEEAKRVGELAKRLQQLRV